jgi:biotin transport system substrate-specific component
MEALMTFDLLHPSAAPTIAERLIPAKLAAPLGSTARDLIVVVAGALLIALSATVSVRLPDNPVPITGQTFGVLLTAGALGGRRGIAATALYVLIGVIGLPAFAEGKGGVGAIAAVNEGRLVLGATGGYLIGFVLASALVGRLAERRWDRRLPRALGAMLAGNAVIYLVGLPWLAAATGFSADETITKGLLPFVLGDALKILLAGAALPTAWWFVGRRP